MGNKLKKIQWYSKSIITPINCAAEIPQEVEVIFIINRCSETKSHRTK